MGKKFKSNWLNVTGAILILIGALSIFSENGTLLHTALQITFVIGCIIFLIGGRLSKKRKNSKYAVALMVLFMLPGSIVAQDYSQQTTAFEKSFHQKDASIIKPFLSDSLQFPSLPIQNTMPVLTNIVTKLPKLNSIQLLSSNNGVARVKYDFEQLGVSESEILFDKNGKITKIEFVDNLIQQQIEQQRKMQSSVQSPQPEKIAFEYSKISVEFPSRDEAVELKALLSDVKQSNMQLQFIPESDGFHGSRALWVDQIWGRRILGCCNFIFE